MSETKSVNLGPLEDRVMRSLWRTREEFSARQMCDELAANGDKLAYTTLATVLNNLYSKALVDRRRKGRAWVYWATGTCSDLAAAQMAEGLKLSRHRERTLNCFIGSLDPEEREFLRAALDRQQPTQPNRPEM